MARKQSGNGRGSASPRGGAERSEAEPLGEAVRGRPRRRSTAERTEAVLELLSGKATVDQLARRFGVRAATVEGWREQALEGIGESLRLDRSQDSGEYRQWLHAICRFACGTKVWEIEPLCAPIQCIIRENPRENRNFRLTLNQRVQGSSPCGGT